jgi:hypothetical protein
MSKNEIVYDVDGNCYIEITSKTHGTQLVQIDIEDIELIHNHKWSVARNPGRREGAQFTVKTNVRVDDKQKTLLLHRYLLGDPPTDKPHVDHIDGDPLNNRRSNLRWVTHQQNMFNRVNTRGYSWNKQLKKWATYIGIDGLLKHLGYFDSEEDAHQAYLTAKSFHHINPAVCVPR